METTFPRSTSIGPAVTLPQPMVLVPEPPTGLQRLKVGAKIEAFVIQGLNKGIAKIDTPFGKLQIATSFPLSTQTSLQLQIIGKYPFIQLLITSVQGQNPQSELKNLTTNNSKKAHNSKKEMLSSGTSDTIQQENSESISLTLGANVVATKTVNNLTQTSAQNSPAITEMLPTKSDEVLAPNNPRAETGARTNTSPLKRGNDKNYTINTTLKQTVNRFSVHITNVLPPSQLSNGGGVPAAVSQSLTIGQSVTGVVTMNDPQGHSVVQTHAGPINLATPNLLPPGTTITFLITTLLNPLLLEPLGGIFNRNAEVIMESNRWPELNDALRTLNGGHPTLGQQVINSILPKIGTELVANIIFLISALRSGDIRNWFGDAPVRALQRMKPELMSRLRDDFSQISQLSDDNISNVWRSYPIPFYNGQEIEQIRLYIKRKSKSEDDVLDPPNQGTRFILDLNLSYIGRFQLDGLVRSSPKKFDLILKTDNPLHKNLQNGIRSVFQKAIEQTGNSGGLTFQSSPTIFIDIQLDKNCSPAAGLIA